MAMGSDEQNRIGPDFFAFYAQEISNLLSQDEDLPSTSISTEAGNLFSKVLEKAKGANGSSDVNAFFNDSIGIQLPDRKRELLKTMLRQSVITLVHEVDEIVDPVVRACQIQNHMRHKRQHPRFETASATKAMERPLKMLKISPSSSAVDLLAHSAQSTHENSGSRKEVNEHLNNLLEDENDPLLEKAMKKCTDGLSLTLHHMEQQLEELLDTVISKCRQMTCSEKHHLRKLIQKLPPKNLDRIVEIIQRNKPVETQPSNEIFVNLEKQDNVTLWRLYFYVKAVENARKLSG